MIFIVTVAAVLVAVSGHLLSLPPFVPLLSIPVAGLSAMGAMGFLGRLVPGIRSHLISIVPPALPWPGAVVWATGICELAGAVGVWLDATRPWAAAGFLLLLVAVFPANVIDARRSGTSEADVRARLLRRGAQQVMFSALAVWTLIGGLS